MDYEKSKKVNEYLKKPLGEEILISLYKLSTKFNEITLKYFLYYYGYGIDVFKRIKEAKKLGLIQITKKGLFKDKRIDITPDGEKIIIGKIYMK